jgi:hypothetical protein
VSAKSLAVFVTNVRERDEEVLPGNEVDLFAQKVKDHEERSLRDLLFFLDRARTPTLSVDKFRFLLR